MTAIVAQLGARMHYAVPRILHSVGLLERLYTDICAVKGWPQLLRIVSPRILPASMKRLRDRIPHDIAPERITAFTHFGYEYAQRRRHARSATETTKVHLWASDRFNALILAQGFGNASLIYGFNSASEQIFVGAKAAGLQTIVEQTIVPRLAELRLLVEETRIFHEWGSSMVDDCAEAFAAQEQQEWILADRILCASEFVRQELVAVGGPAEKCVVVPYGVNVADFTAGIGSCRRRLVGAPLQVLFVGGVGLRKGIPYLLEAMRQLKSAPVRCRIVGGWQVDQDTLRRHIPSNVELVGPILRSEITREYANADVFCLPSLCEGSATVIYEALAAGLPIVTTPNAGSIVRDGVEGFIVPIRDAEAIAERLDRLAYDRVLLNQMSHSARERSTYGSLEAYGERLLKTLFLN